ncbi:putative peptidase M48 Ste24p [Mycobacterium kansasii]|uniref:Putative peptidase M48 Ste24p n=1 Tax=Mycobacterium kansasii TaxID=1768 RepID=A0A1V3WM12_MYCKA|nr:putative peptidase M48 Ste24p [Mycobacterium kansasii]
MTLLIIAGGMITKTVALRQGGAAVAASVGAVQVDPTSSDPQLRRLVNIVEEMSLASGCRRRACSSWRGSPASMRLPPVSRPPTRPSRSPAAPWPSSTVTSCKA